MMQSPVSPLTLAYAKFRNILTATFVFSFFVNLLMFVGPLYMLQVYNRVLSSQNETTLLLISVIAIGMLLVYAGLEFIRSRMLVRAGIQFDQVLASPLFARVVRIQMSNPAAGGRNALSDTDRVRDFITGSGILSFFDAPWTPLFLLVCFAFHFWIGVVATAGAVIVFALALLNEVLTRAALQDASLSSMKAANFAGATLQHADVIRAMGMVRDLCSLWLAERNRMLVLQAKASDWAGMVLALSKFVRMALQIAILGVGAYLVMKREMDAGMMVAASIIMGRALAPVEQAVGLWKQFVAARQSNDRLRKMFETVGEQIIRTRLPDPKGDILVEGMSSTAPGGRDLILRGISFSAAAGEILAVVGPSGSGKSTLLRNLVGIVPPSTGTIRLDGTELSHWEEDQLGQAIGYLPQEIRLFSGTVAQNIARFRPDAPDAEIVAAAQLSGAHAMIQSLKNGYETQVGENGSLLSGGQRQRLGLARAVFSLPKVIVLDEPNSNLDSEGEQALSRCLVSLKAAGSTIIVVTHKINLLSLSDRCLVIGEGLVRNFLPTHEFLQAQAVAVGGVKTVVKAQASA